MAFWNSWVGCLKSTTLKIIYFYNALLEVRKMDILVNNLDSHPGEWGMCSVNFYHLKFKASFNCRNTDTLYYLRNPCMSCISSSCVFSREDKALRDDWYCFAGFIFVVFLFWFCGVFFCLFVFLIYDFSLWVCSWITLCLLVSYNLPYKQHVYVGLLNFAEETVLSGKLWLCDTTGLDVL